MARNLDVSDAELLRRSPKDADAFAAFYRRYGSAVYRMFRSRVSEQDALDLTAETFAQALGSCGRFRGDHADSGRAWVFGISENLWRRYQRTRVIERAACERLGIRFGESRHTQIDDDTDARLDASAGGIGMRQRIATLPEDQRAVVELRIVEEAAFPEIARVLAVASKPLARGSAER